MKHLLLNRENYLYKVKSIVNYIFESVQKDYDEAVRQLTELNQKLDDARKNVEQRIKSEVIPLTKKYYDMFADAAKEVGAKKVGDKEFPYARLDLGCTRIYGNIKYSFKITFGSFHNKKGACDAFVEMAEQIAKENSTTKIKINVEPFDDGYCDILITDKAIETLYDEIKSIYNKAFDERYAVYQRVQELEKRTPIGKNKDKQLKADVKASLDVSNAEEFYRVEGLGESEYATCILLPIIPELLKAVKDGGYKIKMKGTCWALIDYPEFNLEDIDGVDNVIPGDYAVGSSNHECEDSIAYFKENPDFAQALMNAFRGADE